MALTTVSFTTTFNFSTKKFNFADTTDYVTQSISASGVAICFTITDPTGTVIYNNTDFNNPDISPGTSLTNNAIDLPLALDTSDVLLGSYNIEGRYHVDADSIYAEHEVSIDYDIALSYVAPEVEVTLTANCVTPLLKSVDDTSYVIAGVSPTITRAHTIFYPAVLQLANVTGTGSTLQTSTFYTNEHSSEVEATLTYNFTTHYVYDVVTGTASLDVQCDAQLCDIYCCISSEWNRYLTYKTTNKSQADIHLSNWMKMMDAAGMIGISYECGKEGDIDNLVDFILKLGNCQTGCGCTDGDPVPVLGLGGLASVNVAVDSSGAPVTVTSSTAGGITTYHVGLAAATVSKINASYNATVVGGTNISIVTVTDGNNNKTYTVNATTQTPPDMITLLLRVLYQAGGVATLTEVDRKITGTLFKAPTYEVVNGTLGFNSWKNKNNGFKINSFLNAITTEKIKAVANVSKFEITLFGQQKRSDQNSNAIGLSVVNLAEGSDGTLTFKFYDDKLLYLSNDALTSILMDATISVVIHR